MNRNITGYAASAEFYDHTTAYRDKEDIAFYLALAKNTDEPVLELGCGTGRILIPLARAGNLITGLDNSESMLDTCRNILRNEPPQTQNKVKLVIGDMRNFNLGRTFGLVTVPFRAFQHLETTADQLACLECVREHMSEESTFILDLFNPSMKSLLDHSREEEFGDEPDFTMPDGRIVTRRLRNPSVNHAEQLLDCEIIYYIAFPDGTSEKTVHSFKLRYLFRFEAEHLLERAGFRVVDVFGDFNGNPFGSKCSGELILKAELK